MTDVDATGRVVAALTEAVRNCRFMYLGPRVSHALAKRIAARLTADGWEIRPVTVTVPDTPAALFQEGAS